MPIMDENDVSLPKATLSKMIRDFMPADLRLAGETMDMLIECCTEFVSLVSSESNDVSNREKRNTIHPEHVLRALSELGLQEFVKEVTNTWEAWKEEAKCTHKPGNRKTAADAAGLTEEEQIAIQQQLFTQARRSFQLPEANSETAPSETLPGVSTSVDGSSIRKSEAAGSHVAASLSHGYLSHRLVPPTGQSVGTNQLPQHHLGVHPSHQYAYPGAPGDVQGMASHGATVKGEVIERQGQAAGGVFHGDARLGSSLSSVSAEPASRYDVLPIPPLQVQPIPSAFRPSAEAKLLESPIVIASQPQSSTTNKGGHAQESASVSHHEEHPGAQQMFLMRPTQFTPTSAASDAATSVQTVWTQAVPQGAPTVLPELQLSQPVVVYHNGVQHLVPLQTLLSQVGGLQQFRVSPVTQQPGGAVDPRQPPGYADAQAAQPHVSLQPHQSEKSAPMEAEPSGVENEAERVGSIQNDRRDGSGAPSVSRQGESTFGVSGLPLQPTQPMLVPFSLMNAPAKSDLRYSMGSMDQILEPGTTAGHVPLEPYHGIGAHLSNGTSSEPPALNSMMMRPPAIIDQPPPKVPGADTIPSSPIGGIVSYSAEPSPPARQHLMPRTSSDACARSLRKLESKSSISPSHIGEQNQVHDMDSQSELSAPTHACAQQDEIQEPRMQGQQGVKRKWEGDSNVSQSRGDGEPGAGIVKDEEDGERDTVRRKLPEDDAELPCRDGMMGIGMKVASKGAPTPSIITDSDNNLGG